MDIEHQQYQSYRQIRIKEAKLGLNRQKGAIIIYTRKRLRGRTISLCKGFHTNPPDMAEARNVVECKINGVHSFAGIFPALEPGQYTVFDNQQNLVTMISVYANDVAEVDWR
jgi:hypothetical protein